MLAEAVEGWCVALEVLAADHAAAAAASASAAAAASATSTTDDAEALPYCERVAHGRRVPQNYYDPLDKTAVSVIDDDDAFFVVDWAAEAAKYRTVSKREVREWQRSQLSGWRRLCACCCCIVHSSIVADVASAIKMLYSAERQARLVRGGPTSSSALCEVERSFHKAATAKFGLLFRAGSQVAEEDVFGNQHDACPPFYHDVLAALGRRVALKGWEGFSGGLNTTGKAGEWSVYTQVSGVEVMFHVATLLPYSATDKQQLERKRHIGNDQVVVVVAERGATPLKSSFIASRQIHVLVFVEPVTDAAADDTRAASGEVSAVVPTDDGVRQRTSSSGGHAPVNDGDVQIAERPAGAVAGSDTAAGEAPSSVDQGAASERLDDPLLTAAELADEADAAADGDSGVANDAQVPDAASTTASGDAGAPAGDSLAGPPATSPTREAGDESAALLDRDVALAPSPSPSPAAAAAAASDAAVDVAAGAGAVSTSSEATASASAHAPSKPATQPIPSAAVRGFRVHVIKRVEVPTIVCDPVPDIVPAADVGAVVLRVALAAQQACYQVPVFAKKLAGMRQTQIDRLPTPPPAPPAAS